MLDQTNKISIACTIDNNYVQHCCVMLASLVDSNKREVFQIYIIHNGIENENKLKLDKFLSKQRNCSYTLILLNEKFLLGLPDNIPVFGHISLATYFRIFLARILPKDIDKVLFLDSDLLVRKKIRPLWEVDIKDYSHAASINPGLKDHFLDIYPQARNPLYFNAGVLLINLNFWRDNNVLSNACNTINNYSGRLKWWDQDVLNILLNTNWLRIGLTWNATPKAFSEKLLPEELMDEEDLKSIIEDPAIVHYAGAGSIKPWHYRCKLPFRALYKKHLKLTPWSDMRLIEEPPLSIKIREQIRLRTRLKNILGQGT